jgi:hypothetical protein
MAFCLLYVTVSFVCSIDLGPEPAITTKRYSSFVCAAPITCHQSPVIINDQQKSQSHR